MAGPAPDTPARLIYGCMRLVGDGSAADRERGKRAVHAAVDAGYRTFDHADIYGAGECERLFGEVLAASPGLRDELTLIGKCGIRMADAHGPKRYDFSREHLLTSVDGSLDRLGVEHLDVLLLHRPDYLFDPEEVAEAFRTLREAGKVRTFGVSNFSPSQVDLLASALDAPLVANQVEINLRHLDTLSDGTLDQCLQRHMTPQAWSPLAGVINTDLTPTFTTEDKQRLDQELTEQATRYEAAPWQIALAFLLKHPAKIAPIVGSTTPQRIAAATATTHLQYTRADWYRLLEARQGKPVP
ncbi:MAG: aldo/keto reductase [Pseudomonadota bacterium]